MIFIGNFLLFLRQLKYHIFATYQLQKLKIMAKETNLDRLKKKLQSRLTEFRKYRIAKGKITKKPSVFAKIFS